MLFHRNATNTYNYRPRYSSFLEQSLCVDNVGSHWYFAFLDKKATYFVHHINLVINRANLLNRKLYLFQNLARPLVTTKKSITCSTNQKQDLNDVETITLQPRRGAYPFSSNWSANCRSPVLVILPLSITWT